MTILNTLSHFKFILAFSFPLTFFNILPKNPILPIITGTVLALAGHNILEYSSTVCHEMGHALANKLVSGDPISIKIKYEPCFLSSLIQPWQGSASISSSIESKKLANAFVTSAGPTAGILSVQLQLILLDILYARYSQNKSRKSIWQPFKFFKELYQFSKEQTEYCLGVSNSNSCSNLNTLDVAYKVLTFLRCSRLVGESLYGFAPISIPDGPGDGQILWSLLLNRPAKSVCLSDNLLLLTTSIMMLPAILGSGKAIIDKLAN